MIKAKDGKLVSLSIETQKELYDAYKEGGVSIVYRSSYYDIKKAHCLLVTDEDGNEVCTFISKDISRLVALTGNELHGNGMKLEKFIKKYCHEYAESWHDSHHNMNIN